MGRRKRHFRPGGIYFVTNRCAGGRYLLRPDAETRALLIGIMAHYAAVHKIEVLGFVFMSNHFHMILRGRKSGSISDFMRDMQRKISTEIQEIRDDWNTRVFPKRFKCEEILDDASLHELISYMMLNPVKAGLVYHPSEWNAVSSWDLHVNGGSMTGDYLDRNRLRKLKRSAKNPGAVNPDLAKRSRSIEITPPPAMSDLEPEQIAKRLFADIDKRCVKTRKTRSAQGKSRAFGFDAVVSDIDPLDSPEEFEETPEPLCHTRCPALRDAYWEHFLEVMGAYEAAAKRWRDGEEDVDFPRGTYPPGRLKPEPLPEGESRFAEIAFPNRA